jgi:hypothetical protein
MSITVTSRCSLASMMAVSRTDLSAAVGDEASSFSIEPRYLLQPATMRPLMVASRISLRKR